MNNKEKHDRIKDLTYGAIISGQITRCDRQPNGSYIIARSGYLKPETHSVNSALMFLYLLRRASN
ncbi:MAG: hypothetical protein QQW96_03785 [Tychonema bourrellyi B0820]|nr:hypothetical protein [Tychonema bourrellyi B0820]